MNVVEEIEKYDIPVVISHGKPSGDAFSFANEVRGLKGIEGFILVWGDGHRAKIKTEEYSLLHKTKDKVRFDHYVGQLILSGSVDDVIPLLDEIDTKRVNEYIVAFWQHYNYHLDRVEKVFATTYGKDRKTIATEVLKNEDGWTKSIVFRAVDGNEISDVLLSHFKANVNGQSDHEKLMNWK